MTATEVSNSRLDEIGSYIVDHVPMLLREWAEISRREHPEANEEQHENLQNSLPEFLTDFGLNLASGDAEIPREHAIEHGLQRWQIGWDIESLARDFLILRRVLIRHLQSDLELDPGVCMAVAATMDEAVAVSVNSYVAFRENELHKHNEALRRKNYELKRFAHMVAHEVRNPLNMMMLATSALRRLYGEDDQAKPHFEAILGSCDSVTQVLDNLVNYASLGLSDEIDTTDVDLNDVFSQAVDHLKYLVDSTHAEIVADDLPTVVGDQVPLVMLFQNIIENGIKYCGSGKPDIHVSAEDCDDAWKIHFKDHGIGIAEEDQPTIFRFLARVHDDPDIPGTGVGLAMCRRIAEQHAGSLTVESEIGAGSTFTLLLPKDPSDHGAACTQ